MCQIKIKCQKQIYFIISHHNLNKFINIITCIAKYWNAYISYNDFGLYPLFTFFETIAFHQVKVKWILTKYIPMNISR
jgi:hypothetical protein